MNGRPGLYGAEKLSGLLKRGERKSGLAGNGEQLVRLLSQPGWDRNCLIYDYKLKLEAMWIQVWLYYSRKGRALAPGTGDHPLWGEGLFYLRAIYVSKVIMDSFIVRLIQSFRTFLELYFEKLSCQMNTLLVLRLITLDIA